ncbi:MAG: glycogen/starch/alpha-glucan phosphorylase, partial [Planctomycetales bacterium]
REEVGAENIFIFGRTVEEINELRANGSYHPWDHYQSTPRIKRILDAFKDSRFCEDSPGRHDWIYNSLIARNEHYFHLEDLGSYIDAQAAASELYRDQSAWVAKAIMNVACVGKFSSDRTIRQYAEEIWNISPL